MRPVVYAEAFGLPSQVWMWRQVGAAGTPVLTHEYKNPDTFPHEPVWVVPRRRACLDRVRALGRLVRGGHGYTLPDATQHAVIERMRSEGVTLIHAHFGPAGLRMLPVARALGVPLIVTFHGFDVMRLPRQDASYRRALIELFESAWSIAVSDDVHARLAQLGCRDLRRLYLGVPIREHGYPRRSPERTSDAPVRVVAVSRLVPYKSVPDLVDAVRATDGSVELHIVGDGEDRANVEAHADGDPRVVLHGTCSPEEVRRQLAEADIFVINSRSLPSGEAEAFGITVLEAMEAGLPVIGTRHGGIRESVVHGETGLLIEAGDTAALQRAIEQLAGDRARRDAMGEAGRHRVEAEFEIGACTERLLAFYAEVGGSQRPVVND